MRFMRFSNAIQDVSNTQTATLRLNCIVFPLKKELIRVEYQVCSKPSVRQIAPLPSAVRKRAFALAKAPSFKISHDSFQAVHSQWQMPLSQLLQFLGNACANSMSFGLMHRRKIRRDMWIGTRSLIRLVTHAEQERTASLEPLS